MSKREKLLQVLLFADEHAAYQAAANAVREPVAIWVRRVLSAAAQAAVPREMLPRQAAPKPEVQGPDLYGIPADTTRRFAGGFVLTWKSYVDGRFDNPPYDAAGLPRFGKVAEDSRPWVRDNPDAHAAYLEAMKEAFLQGKPVDYAGENAWTKYSKAHAKAP